MAAVALFVVTGGPRGRLTDLFVIGVVGHLEALRAFPPSSNLSRTRRRTFCSALLDLNRTKQASCFCPGPPIIRPWALLAEGAGLLIVAAP